MAPFAGKYPTSYLMAIVMFALYLTIYGDIRKSNIMPKLDLEKGRSRSRRKKRELRHSTGNVRFHIVVLRRAPCFRMSIKRHKAIKNFHFDTRQPEVHLLMSSVIYIVSWGRQLNLEELCWHWSVNAAHPRTILSWLLLKECVHDYTTTI